MELCVHLGLARHIGVSSFGISHLESILETAVVKPSVNQIEMHPYLQQPELWGYLKEHQIAIEGTSALTSLTRVKGGPMDYVCQSLAKKYSVAESSILLRWVIDQGAVAITTSGRTERLSAVLADISQFRLTLADIQAVSDAAGEKRCRGFFAQEFEALESR
jgi:diketogulonate reductase-like aldo/keto reductase